MGRRITTPAFWILLLTALAALGPGPGTARADEGPTAPPAAAADDLPLAVITGERVNLRVGPRMDNHPVAQLDRGSVVLIVERVPGWVGVRVPSGFPCVAAKPYLEMEGPDAVRVRARNLNLRVHPPREGRPAPAIFRDRPEPDALLTLIEDAGEWVWLVAPEGIRAYVSERFVEELGPMSEHPQLLDTARRVRTEEATRLSEARRAAAAQLAGTRLRAVLSEIQAALHEERRSGGYDKVPVVRLTQRLDAAIEEESGAPARALILARTLRDDLEREVVLRVARHDAEVARQQGLQPPAVPPLEEAAETFAAEGTIRYEPTPGWRQEGIYILWLGRRPSYVLRLTTGGQLPHPDFSDHDDAGPRRVVGSKPGERLFGLPVIDVKSITLPRGATQPN
ncbi:MAG: SH3 domain-containing protein [Planctomycetota bacterium]|jgi:hypothetical protein